MKIQYCSDLHLEFAKNKEYLLSSAIQAVGEILLLAGDIMPLGTLHKHDDFFGYIADHFEQTYWIPGNHEYYHYDFGKQPNPLHEKIRPNVSLVDNVTIPYKGVNLLCTTLWSHIKPQHEWEVQQGVTDFHVIKKNGLRLTPAIFNEMHKTSLHFLEQSLKEHAGEKNVVMTHHVPTMMRYPVFFRNSPINDAFAVELQDFIFESNARYWLYGHHHCPIRDFNIGNTTMITNQLGYVSEGQHGNFRTDAVVEL
jgi:predicted phosphohydrolase